MYYKYDRENSYEISNKSVQAVVRKFYENIE